VLLPSLGNRAPTAPIACALCAAAAGAV